jgi:hypothetical protein
MIVPALTDETNVPSPALQGEMIHVDLSRADVALIIDALLQAEMTLPLIDRRYRSMKTVESLRAGQLSLANRLEDLMSGERGDTKPQACGDRVERS